MEKKLNVHEIIEFYITMLDITHKDIESFQERIDLKSLRSSEKDKKSAEFEKLEGESSDILAGYLSVIQLVIKNIIPAITADSKIIAGTAPILLSLYTLFKRMEKDVEEISLMFGSEISEPDECLLLMQTKNLLLEELHPVLRDNKECIEQLRNEEGQLHLRFCPSAHHQIIKKEISDLKELILSN